MDDKQVKNTGKAHRWKKGESGNPKGRPRKEVSLTSLLKKYLDDVPDIQVGGKTNTKSWMELIVQAWLVGAYKGNAQLMRELLDRVEGKVPQPIAGAEGGVPIKITYVQAEK